MDERCHILTPKRSLGRDLKGITSRIEDPKVMIQDQDQEIDSSTSFLYCSIF